MKTQETNSIEEAYESEGDSKKDDSSEEDSSEEYSSREDLSEEVSSAEGSSNEDQREEDGSKKKEQSWQVMVLHQERPVALDVCGGVSLCPLHTFVQVVSSNESTLHYHAPLFVPKQGPPIV